MSPPRVARGFGAVKLRSHDNVRVPMVEQAPPVREQIVGHFVIRQIQRQALQSPRVERHRLVVALLEGERYLHLLAA